MSTDNPGDVLQDPVPPSDEVRAGEFVLGVLPDEAHRAAAARAESDAAFAGQVQAWERHLSPWLLRFEPIAPSPHVWPRIRSALGWPAIERRPAGIWHNAGFWRATTALAAAAGIAAVAVVMQRPTTHVETPPATSVATVQPVAVLADDEGVTTWIATIDITDGRVLMAPVPGSPDPAGRAHELWLIPEGAAPVSLGAISNRSAQMVDIPDALRGALTSGSLLAISLEPSEGIPHTAPTGPIIATGQLAGL